MLQRNMERYGFAPDDEYRQVLADSVHVSDSRYRHLATSYYLHELSRDETLLPQKRAMSPAILAEVIELDGKDTPYGTFHFKPGKIGQVIDVTLRAALQQDDWNKVSKDYDEIPRKLLMKSNVYKGRILCDELGM